MDKRKSAWLAEADTAALQLISDTARGSEVKPPSADYPLGGLVQIAGIGQIPLKDIRDELARREA